MSINFDSMLNVSAVPQDDRTAAFIAESKNNRNRCYELSEQITAAVATDSQMFQKYLDVQSRFDRYTKTARKSTGASAATEQETEKNKQREVKRNEYKF